MRKVVLTAVLVCGLWLVPTAALAADDQVVVDNGINQVQVFSLLVGTILPLAVGLVTKTVTSPTVKALLLAALSAVSGFLTEAINVGGIDSNFPWESAIVTSVLTFVVAVATHYGLWQPTGVADKAQRSLVR